MISYVTIGVQDLEKAGKFYDAVLAVAGAKRAMQADRYVAWAGAKGGPMVMIMKPFDGKPATVGNGTMVALAASSKEMVDAIHKKALEMGGTDEGAPGARGPNLYAGYFRDIDGNKLNAICM